MPCCPQESSPLFMILWEKRCCALWSIHSYYLLVSLISASWGESPAALGEQLALFAHRVQISALCSSSPLPLASFFFISQSSQSVLRSSTKWLPSFRMTLSHTAIHLLASKYALLFYFITFQGADKELLKEAECECIFIQLCNHVPIHWVNTTPSVLFLWCPDQSPLICHSPGSLARE